MVFPVPMLRRPGARAHRSAVGAALLAAQAVACEPTEDPPGRAASAAPAPPQLKRPGEDPASEPATPGRDATLPGGGARIAHRLSSTTALGVEGWVSDTVTMGFSGMYRLNAIRDLQKGWVVGHAMQGVFEIGFHW